MPQDPVHGEPTEDELVDEVIRTFQPLSPVPITREAGREMLHNLRGFFEVLSAIQEKLEKAEGEAENQAPEL
ncbi:MAG: hypothetical protein H6735_13300 [Alphaproteobacteria bacterium]|nr:hypothetical protein [Alphaproteobacteria bacterium]